MTKRREYRSAHIRARDDGHPGVSLKVITPNVVDDYGSVWMADVFDAALDKRMPTLVWGHDHHEPLGPATGWHRDTDGAPIIEFDFSDFEAVPMARRAHAQVSDGTIRDCSVGFCDVERRVPTADERAKWGPRAREVMVRSGLEEVSLVVMGAVPGAKVTSVRSADGGTVSLDAVVELAKKVAAGEMTNAEAKAAIDLLTDDPPDETSKLELSPTVAADDTTVADEAPSDAEIDAALALAGQ